MGALGASPVLVQVLRDLSQQQKVAFQPMPQEPWAGHMVRWTGRVWDSVPRCPPLCGSPTVGCPQLLNCIMDMAEKTRRSLAVLRRCQETAASLQPLDPALQRRSRTARRALGRPPGPSAALWAQRGAQLGERGMCGADAGEPGAGPSLIMALQKLHPNRHT